MILRIADQLKDDTESNCTNITAQKNLSKARSVNKSLLFWLGGDILRHCELIEKSNDKQRFHKRWNKLKANIDFCCEVVVIIW